MKTETLTGVVCFMIGLGFVFGLLAGATTQQKQDMKIAQAYGNLRSKGYVINITDDGDIMVWNSQINQFTKIDSSILLQIDAKVTEKANRSQP